MRNVRKIAESIALVAPLLLAGIVSPALGQQVVSTCGTTCTTTCSLSQDLHCTSGVGVTVSGGGLDMKGFSIYCDAGNVCDTAVKLTGSNMYLQSSIGGANSDLQAGAPRIVGEWETGVGCGNNYDTSVTGITLQGFFAIAAINQCSQVLNNSIGGFPIDDNLDITFPGVSNIGIFMNGSGADTALRVWNNYIDGVIKPIVRHPNSPNVLISISDNTINHRNYSFGVSQPSAITLVSPGPQQEDITGNVVTGDGTGVISVSANHTSTYSGNVCRFPLVGCQSCINQGKCTSPATVFSPL